MQNERDENPTGSGMGRTDREIGLNEGETGAELGTQATGSSSDPGTGFDAMGRVVNTTTGSTTGTTTEGFRSDAFDRTGGITNDGYDRATGFDGDGGSRIGLDGDGAGRTPVARAREIAGTARERAGEKVEEQISRQKHRAADQLGTVAQSLRTASAQLADQNGVSRYMVRAADQVDHLATLLNDRDVAELVDGVEDFARRQPAAFVSGAFALGVLGARFLKSTRREQTSGYRSDEWDTGRRSNFTDERDSGGISRPSTPGYGAPEERGDRDFGGSGMR